jgi:hypothetical protein
LAGGHRLWPAGHALSPTAHSHGRKRLVGWPCSDEACLVSFWLLSFICPQQGSLLGARRLSVGHRQ